jgi:hypothetical protein
MTQEPTLTSAYWHDEFIDIKNPHKKDEFLRVPLNRTWVGLTDDAEIFAISNTMPYANRFEFARAIEAKLKEKNT